MLAALRDCSGREDVLREVRKNHVDNLWWPRSVTDWRMRMLVAGWSTRVSYQHLSHYEAVVRRVSAIGWDSLIRMSDGDVLGCVSSLGLSEARLAYFHSLARFVRKKEDVPEWLSRANDGLIEEFATEVEGAGYKVAQCAVLYAKGYDCGIIPIDSGMVEMLAPLVPVRLPKSAISHEIVRQWVEYLVGLEIPEVSAIASRAGFPGLTDFGSLAWWTHLVLIYYKRAYWNRGIKAGPFRKPDASSVPTIAPCVPQNPPARFLGVLVEGVDGVGKSTLAEELKSVGYEYLHSPFVAGEAVLERYQSTLSSVNTPAVLDRTFLSEYVYGTVVRGHSRLSLDDCLSLLGVLAARGFVVFHLEEAEDILAVRRGGDSDVRRRLLSAYRDVFSTARNTIPVYRVESSRLAPSFLLEYLGVAGA